MDPNTSLAGFALVVSLARSKVSIAAFIEEGAPSGPPIGSFDLVSLDIVGSKGCTAANQAGSG